MSARKNPYPIPEMPRGVQDNLEADIVYQYTMGTVLDALANICFEKADRLEHHWQDPQSASPWRRIGKQIETVANGAHMVGV